MLEAGIKHNINTSDTSANREPYVASASLDGQRGNLDSLVDLDTAQFIFNGESRTSTRIP